MGILDDVLAVLPDDAALAGLGDQAGRQPMIVHARNDRDRTGHRLRRLRSRQRKE